MPSSQTGIPRHLNWINAKAAAAILGAAVIAGTSTYLVQQKQINSLHDENQKLLAQQTTLTADTQAALNAAQSNKDELEKLKKEASDVVRLRGQVAQLTRQRDAERQLVARLSADQKPTPAPTSSAGVSFTKERATYVGYGTPEAALQTIVWATMSGNATAEQIAEGLSSDLLNDQEAYGVFERNRKESQAVFKSVDMLSKKILDENRVELKGVLNVDAGPNAPAQSPAVMVLPLTKVGNQWKLAGNPLPYEEKWDAEGQVQPFGQ